MQMMRARPHVGEDQRPEMHHRQAIRIHRSPRLFRHEVVHDAEESCGEKKTDRVMAIPPLHHRILHTRIGRVRFPHAGRHFRAVDHVQQCDGQNEATEKPVRHIDVRHLALDDGAEKYDRVRDPDKRNQDVDRPFEFGVFLTGVDPHRQRNCSGDNDDLPSPKRECRETVGK